MPRDMSVQRWSPATYVSGPVKLMGKDSHGDYVTYADHARIVAEAGAAVFAFHPEWTVTGMCDSDCLACRRLTELITEREKGYEEGKADAEQEHAAAWDRATFDSTAYEQGKRDGRRTPLRVGDWVRDLSGSEGQITVITDYPDHSPYCVNGQWREGHNLTRIEPPVGWPVGVPDGDAPGGVRWWVRDPGGEYRGRHDGQTGYLEWSDLVAAGGVPALAVTR